MNLPRSIFATVVAAGLFTVPCLAQTQPDNTAQNKDNAVTAQDQSHAKSDRAITRKVRKAIVSDKSLSSYAHNVKVITVNGAVTLKGPVRSDEEKQKVQADAASAVSADAITNELTVKESGHTNTQ
jgi:osmotically-inducible protein OsmY